MTTLVEKVARSMVESEWQTMGIADHEYFSGLARAAIATVLREMMEPSDVVTSCGAMAIIDSGSGDFRRDDCVTMSARMNAQEAATVLKAMLRAFAAEHGIELEKQP